MPLASRSREGPEDYRERDDEERLERRYDLRSLRAESQGRRRSRRHRPSREEDESDEEHFRDTLERRRHEGLRRSSSPLIRRYGAAAADRPPSPPLRADYDHRARPEPRRRSSSPYRTESHNRLAPRRQSVSSPRLEPRRRTSPSSPSRYREDYDDRSLMPELRRRLTDRDDKRLEPRRQSVSSPLPEPRRRGKSPSPPRRYRVVYDDRPIMPELRRRSPSPFSRERLERLEPLRKSPEPRRRSPEPPRRYRDDYEDRPLMPELRRWSPSPHRRDRLERLEPRRQSSSPSSRERRLSPSPHRRDRVERLEPRRQSPSPPSREHRRSPSPHLRGRLVRLDPRRQSPSPLIRERRRSPSPYLRERLVRLEPRRQSPSPPSRERRRSPSRDERLELRRQSPSPPRYREERDDRVVLKKRGRTPSPLHDYRVERDDRVMVKRRMSPESRDSSSEDDDDRGRGGHQHRRASSSRSYSASSRPEVDSVPRRWASPSPRRSYREDDARREVLLVQRPPSPPSLSYRDERLLLRSALPRRQAEAVRRVAASPSMTPSPERNLSEDRVYRRVYREDDGRRREAAPARYYARAEPPRRDEASLPDRRRYEERRSSRREEDGPLLERRYVLEDVEGAESSYRSRPVEVVHRYYPAERRPEPRSHHFLADDAAKRYAAAPSEEKEKSLLLPAAAAERERAVVSPKLRGHYEHQEATISRLLGRLKDARTLSRKESALVVDELVAAGAGDAWHERAATAAINALGRLGHRDEALRMLRSLDKPNAYHYNSAIIAINDRAVDAAELLRAMRKAKIRPVISSYGSALSACRRQSNWRLATELLQEMAILDKIPPDSFAVGTVVSCCEKAGEWKTAVDTVWRYEAVVAEDIIPWNTALAACDRANKGAEADALFAAMLEPKDRKLQPNDVTFSITVRALARSGLVDRALGRLDDFRRCIADPAFPRVTGGPKARDAYVGVIVHAGRHRDHWRTVFAVFDRMRDDGIRPNDKDFASLIAACGRAGDLDRARRVFNVEMAEAGVEATPGCLAALITSYGKAGDVDGAFQLWRDYIDANNKTQSSSEEKKKNLSAATMIDDDDDDDSKKKMIQDPPPLIIQEDSVDSVPGVCNEKASQRGVVTPTSETLYSALMSVCERNGQPSKALALYDQAKKEGVGDCLEVANAAIHSCGAVGDWARALSILEDLRRPDVIAYTSAMAALKGGPEGKKRPVDAAERGLGLLEKMRRVHRLQPNDVTYTTLLGLLGDCGKWSAALEIFQEARRATRDGRNMSPGQRRHHLGPLVSAASWACANAGRVQEVTDIFDESKNIFDDNTVDIYLWNALLVACNNAGDWKKTLDVFAALDADPHTNANEVSYDAKIVALGLGGHWRDALVVLDEFGINDETKKKHPIMSTRLANAGLRACGRNGKWREARELLDLFPSAFGIEVNNVSYNLVIHCCGEATEPEVALELFEELRARPELRVRPMDLVATLVALGTSANYCDKVLELLGDFKTICATTDVAPPHAFAAAICALGKAQRWQRALEMLEVDVVASGCDLTDACVAACVAACSNAGETDKAIGVFRNFASSELFATEATAAHAGILACATKNRVDDARSIFQETKRFVQERTAATTTVSSVLAWPLKALLKVLDNAGFHEELLKTTEALLAAKVIDASSIEGNEHVATALAKAGRFEDLGQAMSENSLALRWDRALEMIRSARDRGIIAPESCYNAAIVACAKADELPLALELLEERRSSHRTITTTKRNSKKLAEVYSALIEACARCGNERRVEALTTEAAKEGLLTKDRTLLVAALGACMQRPETSWKRAIKLVDDARTAKDDVLDKTAWTTAVCVCEKAQQRSQALRLFALAREHITFSQSRSQRRRACIVLDRRPNELDFRGLDPSVAKVFLADVLERTRDGRRHLDFAKPLDILVGGGRHSADGTQTLADAIKTMLQTEFNFPPSLSIAPEHLQALRLSSSSLR